MSGTSVRPNGTDVLGRTVAATPATARAASGHGLGWRITAALARLQGRKLLQHPVFLAGVALALLGIGIFVAESLRAAGVRWDEEGWTVFVGGSMLGLLTMVAANYAALRDRREHTEEQQETLPAGDATNTGGLLVAMLWPAAVAAVLLTATAAYAVTTSELQSYHLLHLVERVLVVAMLGTLGVAIARWIANPFVAPLVAWGLVLFTPSDTPSMWNALSPLLSIASLPLTIWHLAYMAGLTVLFCAVALVRGGRRSSFVVMAAVGLATAAVSAAALLPQVCPSAGRCVI